MSFLRSLFGRPEPPRRKWGEPWPAEEMEKWKLSWGYPFEPSCLNPKCRAPMTRRGGPWIERPTMSCGVRCPRCKTYYSVIVETALSEAGGGPCMCLTHDRGFGGDCFFPFNRRPEPPPDDPLKQNFVVGYIDASTSVLREQWYRARTAGEAADYVSGGVSGELYSAFGVNIDVKVMWVKDEKGVEQDFRRAGAASGKSTDSSGQ